MLTGTYGTNTLVAIPCDNSITACFMIAVESFVFMVFLSAVHLIEFRVRPDQGSLYQPAHVLTKKRWLMFYEKCWKYTCNTLRTGQSLAECIFTGLSVAQKSPKIQWVPCLISREVPNQMDFPKIAEYQYVMYFYAEHLENSHGVGPGPLTRKVLFLKWILIFNVCHLQNGHHFVLASKCEQNSWMIVVN